MSRFPLRVDRAAQANSLCQQCCLCDDFAICIATDVIETTTPTSAWMTWKAGPRYPYCEQHKGQSRVHLLSGEVLTDDEWQAQFAEVEA